MRHLAVTVLLSLEGGNASEACSMALDILVNIGARIDCTGRRRVSAASAFLEEVLLDERSRSLHFMRCSDHFAAQSTVEYANVASSLFPAVHCALVHGRSGGLQMRQQSDRRMVTVRALELLSKLASVSENAVMVCRSPDSLLYALVDLLCVSNAVTEPLVATVDPGSTASGDPAGRLRPPATVLGQMTHLSGATQHFQTSSAGSGGGSYLGLDHCDVELRDLAADCLLSMGQAAHTMLTRIADIPNAVQLLQRIAYASQSAASITAVSQFSAAAARTEGNAKAAQLLGLLFALPQCREAYLSVKTSMVLAASADEALSGNVNIYSLMTFEDRTTFCLADVVCNKAAAHNAVLIALQPPVAPLLGADQIQPPQDTMVY